MNQQLKYLIAIFICFTISCETDKSLLNNDRPAGAALYGKIYDGYNQPCESVTVTLAEINGKKSQFILKTDVMGTFYFTNLEYTDYVISLKKENYKSLTQPMALSIPEQSIYIKMYSEIQLEEMVEDSIYKGLYTEAETYLRDLYEINPLNTTALFLEAINLWRIGSYSKALENITKIEQLITTEDKFIIMLKEKLLTNLDQI